jgi:two-component system sensor histidine kinase LytS
MLLFVWLAAPLVYRWLSDWVNRRALNRPYSAIAAERLFADAMQSTATEEQLRGAAIRTLESIFLCQVEVVFEGIPPAGETGELLTRLNPTGFVRLYDRQNEAPYLSDDRALLRSLAGMLGSSLQAVREQELRTLASRAELRALRAQINPHFLFNALNTVAGSIRTHPEVADDTLIQLAEVFRYTLARSENEWVRLTDEIAFVHAYLAVEQARFGDRLRVTILGEPDANIRVPAMIIQPLVENAIKHGTAELTGPGKVVIEMVCTASQMNIRVIDNGPGFPENFRLEDDRAGHGLRNVAQRLRGYYGEAGNLRWQNSVIGTVVTIEMPVEAPVTCVS